MLALWRSAPLQRIFCTGFPHWVLPFALLAAFSGCSEEPFVPNFGDPYEIITNDVPGAPDKPPRLLGDWLLIMVAYSGGCEDHVFDVESVVRQDTAHVWVKHNNSGDSCEAYVVDELSLELPTGILTSRVIAMHDPAGDPPHLLKWP